MAEYIEREALAADLRGSYEELRNIYNGLRFDEERRICSAELNSFMECIIRVKNAPAADVVEVVRCKDCTYGEHCYPSKCIGEEAEPAYWCNITDKIVGVDAYCVYGKKMDGKGEGE